MADVSNSQYISPEV